MKVCILDTETTGLQPDLHRVIDVCVRDRTDKRPIFYRRLDPKQPIPADMCHGISDSDVEGMPDFDRIADELRAEIEYYDVVVGYNPDFDIEMLKAEFRRVAVTVEWPKYVVCLKRLWDKHLPPEPRHLSAAVAKFLGREHVGAHGALADVAVTLELLEKQLVDFKIEGVDLSTLDTERAKWVCGSFHFQWKEGEQPDIVCSFGKWRGASLLDLPKDYFAYIRRSDFPQGVKDLVNKMTEYRAITDPARRAKAIFDWALAYR